MRLARGEACNTLTPNDRKNPSVCDAVTALPDKPVPKNRFYGAMQRIDRRQVFTDLSQVLLFAADMCLYALLKYRLSGRNRV
jgi:hypothetical protein